MRLRQPLIAVVAILLVAAACGSDGSGDEAATATTEAPTITPTTIGSTLFNPFPEPPPAPEFVEIRDADTDRGIPASDIENATGSVGFSRYVYSPLGDEVVPFLVEGPRGAQTRCQDEALPCSFPELRDLYESGAAIPEELNMDRATLGELVAQLQLTADFVASFESIDDACERGFDAYTVQNANMGIHMVNVANVTDGFDPANPEVILFASPTGDGLSMADQGSCGPDGWTGSDDYQAVGAVFLLGLSEEHPEGFAGDIDNWHVHYNTCVGVGAEGSPVPPEDCQAGGGQYYDVVPQWMMHAYTADDFENQVGVFSMWNPTVWPLVDDGASLEDIRSQLPEGEGTYVSINNFDFGDITVDAGSPLVVSNSDSVPHTFTAGTPTEPLEWFDSGAFGTGQAYELTFDDPGTYAIYCTLHPSMTADVVVE